MSKKKINGLASFVNNATKLGDKAPSMEGKASIVYIPIEKLIPNQENFYGLRNVESLAGLISMSRHVEPLTVIAREDGNYTILSGHRRRAAVEMLIEKEGFPSELPCIITDPKPIVIEQEDGSNVTFTEAQVELFQLIASNRGQREERTLEEKRQEIKILEPFAKAIYAQKRAEGYRGVYRDFFAEEILAMSSSQLQRMQSIDKLSEKVRQAVNDGLISESSAWELASMSHEEQDNMIDAIKSGELTGTVKSVKEERRRRDEEKESFMEDEDEEPPYSPFQDVFDDSEGEDDFQDPAEEEKQEDKKEEEKSSARKPWEPPIPKTKEQREEDSLSYPSERGFRETLTSELPEAPEEQPDDPQEEAEKWFKEAQLIAYQSIYEEAKRMKKELADTETIKSMQWGIREAVALYRLEEFRTKNEM